MNDNPLLETLAILKDKKPRLYYADAARKKICSTDKDGDAKEICTASTTEIDDLVFCANNILPIIISIEEHYKAVAAKKIKANEEKCTKFIRSNRDSIQNYSVIKAGVRSAIREWKETENNNSPSYIEANRIAVQKIVEKAGYLMDQIDFIDQR